VSDINVTTGSSTASEARRVRCFRKSRNWKFSSAPAAAICRRRTGSGVIRAKLCHFAAGPRNRKPGCTHTERSSTISPTQTNRVPTFGLILVLSDPLSLTIPDPAHSQVEDRWIVLGHSYQRKLLGVVHTEPGDNIPVISPRWASLRERKSYKESD
jgi:uncharacterized DUF497 family protein